MGTASSKNRVLMEVLQNNRLSHIFDQVLGNKHINSAKSISYHIKMFTDYASIIQAQIPEIKKKVSGCDMAFEHIEKGCDVMIKTRTKMREDIKKTHQILLNALESPDIKNIIMNYIGDEIDDVYFFVTLIEILYERDSTHRLQINSQYEKITKYFLNKKPIGHKAGSLMSVLDFHFDKN